MYEDQTETQSGSVTWNSHIVHILQLSIHLIIEGWCERIIMFFSFLF